MSGHQIDSGERQSALKRKADSGSADSAASVHPLLTLQSQIGNAQVARLLAQRADDEEAAAKHDLAQRAEDTDEHVGIEGGQVGPDTQQRIQSERGGGSALGDGMREKMEAGFGTSFDDVRVHQNDTSNTLASRLTSHAFTTGNDIFLRGDASASDEHLMAHELTHVVQQRSMTGGGGMHVGAAGDANEQHADSMATTVLSGSGPATATASASTAQRADDEEAAAKHDLSVQRADDEEAAAKHDLSVQRADDEEAAAKHDLSVQRADDEEAAAKDEDQVAAMHDLSLQRASDDEEGT